MIITKIPSLKIINLSMPRFEHFASNERTSFYPLHFKADSKSVIQFSTDINPCEFLVFGVGRDRDIH